MNKNKILTLEFLFTLIILIILALCYALAYFSLSPLMYMWLFLLYIVGLINTVQFILIIINRYK